MPHPTLPRALALSLGLWACHAWSGEHVRCTLLYGGETFELRADPVATPAAVYDIAPTAIGSYFLFRIVFQRQPARDAAIKLYVYADRDRGPVPLQQASYAYPPAQGRHGFTGQQTVYEPVRDGELQYTCRWVGPSRGTP